MTKLSRVLGAAMLCLGVLVSTNVVIAKQDQAMPAKDPQQKEQTPKTTTIKGTVSAVTESSLTIIDSKKAEYTLTITSETKVTKAGKDATLADVKTSDIVTIEAKKGEGDTWTALKISLS